MCVCVCARASLGNKDKWIQMYILSFNLKVQLLLLLKNVYEVRQSTPALGSFFTMCDSTRQNGLITQVLFVFRLTLPE